MTQDKLEEAIERLRADLLSGRRLGPHDRDLAVLLDALEGFTFEERSVPVATRIPNEMRWQTEFWRIQGRWMSAA